MSLTPAIKNSLFLLVGVVFVLIITPTLFPKSYYEPTGLTYAPPSWQHPCGTDLNGRDLLYRILTGGQISILIGCCGAFISLFVGNFCKFYSDDQESN